MDTIGRYAYTKHDARIPFQEIAKYGAELRDALGVRFTRDQEDHYIVCRWNGCTKQLAAALALKKFPGIRTDSTFMKGKLTGDASFKTAAEAAWYQAQAEAAGVSTTGKHYYRGMASFPGDPEAWLDSRGDVERLAEKRGWNVEGAVNVKAPELPPAPEVVVDPAIVDREAGHAMESDPGARRDDIREQVYNRLAGKGS